MVAKTWALVHNLWAIGFLVVVSVAITVGFSMMAAGRNPKENPFSTLASAIGTPNATPAATRAAVASYPPPGSTPLRVITPPPPLATSTAAPALNLPETPLPPSTYISRELVLAARGSGQGQIGIREVNEARIGPPAFATDAAGNVYVIDSVNYRVNKYDRQGTYLSGFSYDKGNSPDSVAVWKDGSVFLADEAVRRDEPSGETYQVVWKFDPQGRPLLNYKWYGIYHIEDVRLDSGGTVWAGAIGGGNNLVATRLGSVDGPIDRGQVQSSQQSGMAHRGGVAVLQLFNKPDRRGGYVELTLSDGRSLQLPLPVSPRSDATSAGSMLVDTDAQGNIYLDMAYRRPQGAPELHILAYDAQGNLTGQAELPEFRYWAVPRRPYHIDEQGRIYQMLVAQDSIRILCWEKV